jgi:hypothetical protein
VRANIHRQPADLETGRIEEDRSRIRQLLRLDQLQEQPSLRPIQVVCAAKFQKQSLRAGVPASQIRLYAKCDDHQNEQTRAGEHEGKPRDFRRRFALRRSKCLYDLTSSFAGGNEHES